jgi:glycosyltransferase involved in cell wall biosynthesis
MGLDLLLAALAKVRDAGVALELEILGKGPERANLEALSDELGLQDHVRFAGFVADEDLATHYGAADLSLVPTVAHEGFGLVVLESLACGTPVLASDLGGLSEVLGSFSPEMLVKPGDVDALAGALMAIARQETPLATAQRCRDYAEAFSWKASVTQQLALLTGEQLPRVAIFGHHAKLSGGELAMARQVPALNFADITVILGSPGPLVDRLRSDGIRVELLALPADLGEVTRAQANGLAGLRSAFASLRYVFRLARYLRKQRFDILQTNTLKAALIGGLAGRLSGTRVVWHLRDRITDDYLGHRSALAVRLAAKILPSWVIANSVSTAKTLRADLQEMTVIASPIDPSIVAVDRQSRDASQPMRIGIMGRLAAWKGQDLFLSAFAEAFSATAVEAVVIGSPLFGEEDFAAQLEAQAKSLSIASQVDFRGFREDVAAELARLDILVHASILPEPFGQVIVEGMASGLAVIVSNAGGAGEIISDDLDGLLVDPGDREALKNAMLLLVHDQQLRTRLGLAALETAKAYRREGLSERYREVWSGLMGASLRV